MMIISPTFVEKCNMLFLEYKDKHEKLFPLATMESQALKFEEEVGEFFAAEGDARYKEIADVIITCIGMSRFNRCAALNCLIGFAYVSKATRMECSIAVDKVQEKWAMNEKRTWKYNPETGDYHHEGEDEYD